MFFSSQNWQLHIAFQRQFLDPHPCRIWGRCANEGVHRILRRKLGKRMESRGSYQQDCQSDHNSNH